MRGIFHNVELRCDAEQVVEGLPVEILHHAGDGLCALAFESVLRMRGVTPIGCQRASFAYVTSQIEFKDSAFSTWQ